MYTSYTDGTFPIFNRKIVEIKPKSIDRHIYAHTFLGLVQRSGVELHFFVYTHVSWLGTVAGGFMGSNLPK